MKIAINGSIIETENIYEITPINQIRSQYKNHFGFEIRIFNNELPISINKVALDEQEITVISDALTKVREGIIALWSNNQSKIPQINY